MIKKDESPVDLTHDLLQKLIVCSFSFDHEQPQIQDIPILASLRELVLDLEDDAEEDYYITEASYAPLSGIGARSCSLSLPVASCTSLDQGWV